MDGFKTLTMLYKLPGISLAGKILLTTRLAGFTRLLFETL